MSHCWGVRCATHAEVIEPDTCPERGCYGEHGWTSQPCNEKCPKYTTEGDTMPDPKKCTIHGRENCPNGICRQRAEQAAASSTSSTSTSPADNAGQVGIDNQGDLTIGIGGGLGIDTSDGSLTYGSGGFSIDTDGE